MRVEFDEFKEKLPELMGRVLYSDEHQVIITKNGTPVAKLVDYYNEPRGVRQRCRLSRSTTQSKAYLNPRNPITPR